MDFEFRPFFHDNHRITFRRNVARKGLVRPLRGSAWHLFASRTPRCRTRPLLVSFAPAAYCFDICYAASSRSYLTPKLANVLENPTKKRRGTPPVESGTRVR